MFAFGIGAALPLLLLGLFVPRNNGWLAQPSRVGREFRQAGLDTLLIAIGALAITRLDKSIKTVLVAASPQMVDRSDDTVLDRRAQREGYSSDDGSG
jgi:hypothetical protein